jgi:hypothetical protein
MTIVGRTYLERGAPVVVVAQWRPSRRGQLAPGTWLDLVIVVRDGDAWRTVTLKGAPRNVMIRRAGGALVVRPFRGLRRSGTGIDSTGRAPLSSLR